MNDTANSSYADNHELPFANFVSNIAVNLFQLITEA